MVFVCEETFSKISYTYKLKLRETCIKCENILREYSSGAKIHQSHMYRQNCINIITLINENHFSSKTFKELKDENFYMYNTSMEMFDFIEKEMKTSLQFFR